MSEKDEKISTRHGYYNDTYDARFHDMLPCAAGARWPENCRFYPRAAAELAGYRPYLRYRPELAPLHTSVKR